MATQFNLWHKKGETSINPRSYDRQTARFLAVLGENMPEVSADIMQGWIENPKALQRMLSKALCPSEPPSPVRDFPAWRTMRTGTERSMKDISKALMNNGFRISEWALDVLKKIPTAIEETDVDLVNVSVRDLGFEEGATRGQIYDRAMQLGLGLIPAEIGPQLRLHYEEQPLGEWLLMGMEPLIDSDGRSRVFYLERDIDGHWLDTDNGTPARFWYSSYRWIFSRGR